MANRNEVLDINITDTPLGMNWKLTLAGKVIAGGYSKNMWAALDEANESLAGYVRQVARQAGVK